MTVRLGWSAAAVLLVAATSFAQPANDACSAATPVGEGTHAFDTTTATNDYCGVCGASCSSPDVWFLWTIGSAGTATATTCGLAGYDTVLEAMSVCGGPTIVCNDDACGLQSRISLGSVTPGQQFLIRVSGYAGSTGSGSVSLSVTPAAGNDACANAQAVGDGSYPFDTNGATNDYCGTCGASCSSPDIWYLWTVGADGCAMISTCGSGYDTVLEVLSACGGPSIACNDDSCGLQSNLTIPNVTTGQQLLVRVSGYANQTGSGTLSLSVVPSNPYNPPPGGTTEPEPCDGTIIPDGINGGCNDSPPMYGAINCGQTIYGTTESNPSCCRDTDWFLFTLPADDTVTFSGQAQANMNCIVVTGTCPTSIIAISPNSACSPDFNLSVFLSAGTYALVMVPVGFPLITCGSGLENYWVTMSTGLGCSGSWPPSGSASAVPNPVFAGNSTLLRVNVTPGGNPPSTGLAVTMDLSSIGGSPTQTLYDDGTNGDVTAGDNIFSYNYTVPGTTLEGAYTLSFNITDAESRSGSGSFTLNVQSAPCWDETANGGGDAGEFTTNPQTTTGSGTLCSIAGTLGASDADLYVIEICDAANFLATTSNSYTTFDTQLWLFQLNGAGVVANDDDPLGGLTSRITSTFIPGNGTYLLGISRYNRDPLSETGQLMWNNTPFNVERTPDGPGAGGTLSSWTGTTTGGASYRIFLTGACFPGPSCDPDVNCDGSADGFDVEAMEQAVGGDFSNFCQADADFNGDGSVDGFDVESVEQVVGGAPCP